MKPDANPLTSRTSDAPRDREIVNNSYYDQLGEAWFTAEADPIALLRAEGRLKNSWVIESLRERNSDLFQGVGSVLDVGCGGGFLTLELARHGVTTIGLDYSHSSLEAARERAQREAPGCPVTYVHGDAYTLPFGSESFAAVTCMDFLEHVSEPERVIAEISRVLKPGGHFYFHTFNRNRLAQLVVIKGLEWFVRNTPADLHVYKLFIRPEEMKTWMSKQNLSASEWRGLRPRFERLAFWKMLWTGRVPQDFEFTWCDSLAVSYAGCAQKAAKDT
jgi:2-polyprenyl-6-hydroxyphenyl methylase/3-demethylubiquinone-9 3-methyltransferase